MSTRTIEEIIDAFGGTSAFGRVIGVNTSTAGEMKRRAQKGGGMVHPRHWKRIVEAEPIGGPKVTHEELVEAHILSADRGVAA